MLCCLVDCLCQACGETALEEHPPVNEATLRRGRGACNLKVSGYYARVLIADRNFTTDYDNKHVVIVLQRAACVGAQTA